MTNRLSSATMLHKQERALLERLIEDVNDDALCVVPAGYSNNILWNLGHIVASQQLLTYKLSGLDMYVSDEFVVQFRGGTSPVDWQSTPDIIQIKSFLQELPNRFEEDLEAGLFVEYQGYSTSTGLELKTFEDGVIFNQFHEGIHTGVIMALKKLVAA
jgi:hypothetical protein